MVDAVKDKGKAVQPGVSVKDDLGPYERIGLFGWLLLYVTGALLLFFLASHVWLSVYGSLQPATLKGSQLLLGSTFVRVVELGLLFLAVVHGMIGVKRIMLELDLAKKKGNQYLNWCFVVAAFLILVFGIYIFILLTSEIGVQ
jgi:succinate dehydrogenase hydrophobic anchor subunit